MQALLTSTLGGYSETDGRIIPAPLPRANGFLNRLKSIWPANARALFLCADPAKHAENDAFCACFRQSLPMSGLSTASVELCDGRNPDAARNLRQIDALFLMGGHVPTQNRFLKRLRLRKRLPDYAGILVAWSAGSMNCADVVYACPELDGEAVDPLYERWIPGLGITDIQIFPHLQGLREVRLDGMRLVEDIVLADSFGHEIIALNDGSYIAIDDGRATVCGEAYRIRDGRLMKICGEGMEVSLEVG